MHTWACYILSVHTGDNESVYLLLLPYFFFCVCVELFLHINILYMCVLFMRQLPNVFYLILDIVIRRSDLHWSFFCFFLWPEGDGAAGSCQLSAVSPNVSLLQDICKDTLEVTPCNNQTVHFNHLSSYMLLKKNNLDTPMIPVICTWIRTSALIQFEPFISHIKVSLLIMESHYSACENGYGSSISAAWNKRHEFRISCSLLH